MLPIRTDVARKRPTLITYWIMGICTLTFLVTSVLEHRAPETYAKVVSMGALHGDFEHALRQRLEKYSEESPDGAFPEVDGKFDYGEVNPARPWQYITYQFLHGSWLHLLGNMLILWVFGPVIEDRFRRWWFLGFYLAAGVCAGLVHSLFEGVVFQDANTSGLIYTPVIGASGSIAGVTGAFLVLFPQSRIDIIWFIGIIGRFSIPAWWFIGFAIARDFLFQAMGGGNVAHWAHIGGYAFGIAAAFLALSTGWVPREPYNLFSITKQAHRRRAYRELVRKHGSGFVADAGQQLTPDDDTGRAEKRAEVFAAIRSGNVGGAAERFAAILANHPDEVLPRDQQLVIANHWFTTGRHALAAKAYEGLLRKYPDDRERHETALMLALICARYLNDPVRATQLLSGIDRDALSEGHQALVDTLRSEIM